MDLTGAINPERRAVHKFYSRIQNYLDDVDPRPRESKRHIGDALRRVEEKDKYGEVTRAEFELVLAAHDPQSDKPTKCDRILGGSFAKLLYAKTGLHNPSSTGYLAEDLCINDQERDTFLGGHSKFIVSKEDRLESLRKQHCKIQIRLKADELLKILKNEDIPINHLERDVMAVYDIDNQDGNAMALRGRFHMRQKEWNDAIKYFTSALDARCDDFLDTRNYLAECLYQEGHRLYRAAQYEQASGRFLRSLEYKSDHEASRLHLNLCGAKIQESRRPFGYQQLTSHYARRR